MISKEEADKARQTIIDYEFQCNQSLVKDFTCISCKTNKITPCLVFVGDHHSTKFTEQEKGMWDNGTVERISFGYGSKNDCSSFYISICDDCITQLEKDNIAINLKDVRKTAKEYGI